MLSKSAIVNHAVDKNDLIILEEAEVIGTETDRYKRRTPKLAKVMCTSVAKGYCHVLMATSENENHAKISTRMLFTVLIVNWKQFLTNTEIYIFGDLYTKAH